MYVSSRGAYVLEGTTGLCKRKRTEISSWEARMADLWAHSSAVLMASLGRARYVQNCLLLTFHIVRNAHVAADVSCILAQARDRKVELKKEDIGTDGTEWCQLGSKYQLRVQQSNGSAMRFEGFEQGHHKDIKEVNTFLLAARVHGRDETAPIFTHPAVLHNHWSGSWRLAPS